MSYDQAHKRYRLCFGSPLSRASARALTSAPVEQSGSTLVVELRDQSELHGLIRRVEDLGLELVSINPA